MEQVATSSRPYKSRKTRPCDFCRRRRVTCDMPTGPPCHRCAGKSQPCTFEQGPSRRRGPAPEVASEPYVQRQKSREQDSPGLWRGPQHSPLHPQSSPAGAMDIAMFLGGVDAMDWVDVFNAPGTEPVLPEAAPGTGYSPRVALPSPRGFHHEEAAQPPTLGTYTSTTVGKDPANTDGSLEYLPGAFSFYIGPTGAADVHLLARQPYDASNLTRPRVSGLRYRRMADAEASRSRPPILFGITDRVLLEKAEPRPTVEAGEPPWARFWKIVDNFQAGRLVQLYLRFVDPYFPVLSRHQVPADPGSLKEMPLALLTAICALALPFVVYDEALVPLLLHPPSCEQLYRLCWFSICEELHAPSLATVQACLLLQQRLPTNPYLSDTAFTWSLMSTAVAGAQTIGLHRDPSSWLSVPHWERALRRRLWWSVWSMEKWVALARGMPSHIAEDDHDVEPLVSDDMEGSTPPSSAGQAHLPYLVSLTTILSDIQYTYYTVKASRRTSNDLQYSLDVARLLRQRLKDWKDNLPLSIRFGARAAAMSPHTESPGSDLRSSEDDLDGNGSLHLSYIVTHMNLFRALLRPLEKWQESAQLNEALHDGAKAVVTGALLCVKEFVEFIEALVPMSWNAFWHSWSRANFAMAGIFMVHLLHVVTLASNAVPRVDTEQEHRELQDLIKRWRSASRSANGASGMKGLVNLGLLRVETMLGAIGPSSGE
ncbi:hypothetical protein GQ53DRAFT_886652 [Thozetella sp. PMI_491]|nr:hypothetical protein GQ53DRAFT_886652 [Thozetella sp. PMI_491]